MLNQMTEGYDVNLVYVLDMYRYGKVGWIFDTMLRLSVCVIVAVIIWGIRTLLGRQKNSGERYCH